MTTQESTETSTERWQRDKQVLEEELMYAQRNAERWERAYAEQARDARDERIASKAIDYTVSFLASGVMLTVGVVAANTRDAIKVAQLTIHNRLGRDLPLVLHECTEVVIL